MEDIILNYLNQTATDQEMKTLLHWLEQKEENQRQYATTRDLWLVSGATLSSHYGESGKAFRLFKQKASAFEARKKKGEFRQRLLKVAAVAALFILCSLAGYFTGKESTSTDPQVVHVVMNQAIMGAGHKGSVTLPDGTLVWLNSNSKLSYPDQFERNTRIVRLEGEGYFEVEPNKEAPFYVETTDMTVKVLGTHFDVKNYDQKNMFETILLSGKVEVQMKKNREKLVLLPNEKLSFDKQTNTYDVEQVDAEEYTLWTADKLIFEDEKLATIIRKMERWYGISISCRQGVPLHSSYSLTIRNETKEEILKMLSIIAPIAYQVQGDEIILSKRK